MFPKTGQGIQPAQTQSNRTGGRAEDIALRRCPGKEARVSATGGDGGAGGGKTGHSFMNFALKE